MEKFDIVYVVKIVDGIKQIFPKKVPIVFGATHNSIAAPQKATHKTFKTSLGTSA